MDSTSIECGFLLQPNMQHIKKQELHETHSVTSLFGMHASKKECTKGTFAQ